MRVNKVVDIRTRVKIGRILGAVSSVFFVGFMVVGLDGQSAAGGSTAASLKGQSSDGLMVFSVVRTWLLHRVCS